VQVFRIIITLYLSSHSIGGTSDSFFFLAKLQKLYQFSTMKEQSIP